MDCNSLQCLSRAWRMLILVVLLPALGAACDDEPSGPEQGYTIRRQSGDGQFGGFGQLVEEPMRVVVEDANTGEPGRNIPVTWSVVSGSGATLGSSRSTTDASGVASNTLRLGPTDSQYRVRATVAHLVGSAATFDAQAVPPARIDSVSPAAARAGETILIHGSGFSTTAGSNTVLVAGFRATVVEAAATLLRAVVPACVPTRTAPLRVDLGSVMSNTVSLAVTASDAAPTDMSVGQVIHLADANAASCLRLSAPAGARYLLLLQNAAELSGQQMPWRLAGATIDQVTVSGPTRQTVSASGPDASQAVDRKSSPQATLDASLRDVERRSLEYRTGAEPLSAAPAAPGRVEVGDRRDFWVFRSSGDYARVTAEVRHVSRHAILYEDLDTPRGGFEPGDFQTFGELFDDPIYETMVNVYGETSDVDGNGRVIILFTPVVNRMTPPGSGNAFVAGFFFGIDLLSNQSRGNRAEIFYTLVPDPDGEFGNVRTLQQILQGVPPVMAHEFQHMIHFNQRVLLRGGTMEATWLSEGLAHTAEELVGDVYVARGADDRAFDFRIQNFLRADMYLDDPGAASPLGPAATLPVRGASWLLLEYVQSHFGGEAALAALTSATVTGAANISARTALPWGTVLSRWGIALWADDAGISGLDPAYAFPELDLRAVYRNMGFPLQPQPLEWMDFGRIGTLPAGGSNYWVLDAGTAGGRLNVGVAGRHAPLGATDRPQLTILRME